MKNINWKTVAATNDAGSPAEALLLADRLALIWKESSRVAADYRYTRKTHPGYSDRIFSQKMARLKLSV